MQNKKIGVGIVGLSAQRGWASQTHAPALAKLPQFELRGLTASSPETGNAAAKKYGVPSYADAGELAAQPDIDLVVVSVKVIEHRAPVEAAVNAGKHVLCEWPLGKGLEEAEAMAALARAKGVRGFLGLQARFQPALGYLRDLIAEGYLGDVLSTSIIASGGGARGGGRIPQAAAFYADRRSGGGMLNIPFGHTIDGLCWLFGELVDIKATVAVQRPTATIAETGETIAVTTPDHLALSGSFANGAVASIGYRSTTHGTGFHWEINCDKGALLVTGPIGHLQLAALKIYGATGKERAFTELPILAKYGFGDTPIADMSTAVGRMYEALAEDLRTGSHMVATFDDAVRRHKMIDAIERMAGGG